MFASLSETLLDALKQLPQYIPALFTGSHKYFALAGLVVFILALFVSRKLGRVLRAVYVIFACASGAVAYYQKNFPYLVLMALSLLVLIIVRLIFYLTVTVRQNRINAKIEAKALAKARKRRGSWKNKQGYSGDAKPIYDPDEVTAGKNCPSSGSNRTEDEEEMVQRSEKTGYMNRRQVMEAVSKLKDLKDLGILTEEEFNEKKSELYSRLG